MMHRVSKTAMAAEISDEANGESERDDEGSRSKRELKLDFLNLFNKMQGPF